MTVPADRATEAWPNGRCLKRRGEERLAGRDTGGGTVRETSFFDADVVVVGGAGHVGLPLSIALASRGLRVTAHDIDTATLARIAQGEMPFREDGADPILREVLSSGTLRLSDDPASVSSAEYVIVVVGTPVDEHLAPDADAVPAAVQALLPRLRDGQVLILRSTVYPGVTRRVEQIIADSGVGVDVAFCPERIAEGRAMTELFELPQIVSARNPTARMRSASLFGKLTTSIVELSPEEAELAKLFTNAWRYIQFAAANQFFMMSAGLGVDFDTVRAAMSYDYPRASGLPGAGFAAGPCLFKDTMQLAALGANAFPLGHSAMIVNEGLPQFVVDRLSERMDLSGLTVGILGMAFKGESDDVRSSLSYRLKRLLNHRAREVLTTDPYVSVDPDLLPLDEVLERADVLVIAAPHEAYRGLQVGTPVADIWGITESSRVL
jgi:UDP-N-acetyl-D-mannosaminuronic acid dehydrogenase